MGNSLKAFYASPFSEDFRWIRDAVATACREHKVDLKVVDETVLPGGNIVNAMHKEIDDCDFAFAVLTDSNPNVFYELGRLLQASKPTILLISEKQSSQLPFDVRAFSVISYKSREQHRDLTGSMGSAIGRVRLALDPNTRSPSIEAQAVSAKTFGVAHLDFQKIRKEAERWAEVNDCETVEIKNYDTDSFKGWNQKLECPNGDEILIVIDLNGEIVKVKKK